MKRPPLEEWKKASETCLRNFGQLPLYTDRQIVELCDYALSLEVRLREAEDLIESIIDPEDCWHDHHGNCQAHLQGNPCPQATAKAYLRGIKGE